MKKFMITVFVAILLAGCLNVAFAIDNAEFAAKLSDVQKRFKDGEYFAGNDGSYTNLTQTSSSRKCNGVSNYDGKSCVVHGYCGYGGSCTCSCGTYYYGGSAWCWQCWAFACQVGYDIFGIDPFSHWGKSTDVSKVVPGDIVRYSRSASSFLPHVIFVTSVTNGTVYYGQSNYSGPCRVDWNQSMSISALQTLVNNGVNLGKSECAVYHASNNNCTQGSTPISISFSQRSDWTVINETDAKVGVYIDVTGTSLSEVHHIRCQLFDGNGKKLVERYEPTYQSGNRITHYYLINDSADNPDLKYALTPGTTYKYRFIVYVGGSNKEYASEYYTFKTKGTAPGEFSYLDVNGMLDGQSYSSTGSFGTFDVRVDDMLQRDDTNDYSAEDGMWSVGFSQYLIEDIKAMPGYEYLGAEGALSGTFKSGGTTVILKFATKKPEITYQSMPTGEYTFQNKSTGSYLTLEGAADEDKTNISVSALSSNGNGQVFRISSATQGYHLIPTCSSTNKVVNPYAYTPSDGTNVNLYHQESDGTESSQWWQFQPVSDGYILHNVMKPELVLSVSGSNVIVSTYAGTAEQVWKVEPYKVSTATVSWTDRHCFPFKRSAYLAVKMVASESGTFSDFHLRIWNKAGNLVASKDETSSGMKTSLNIWYEIYSETGTVLQPDTEYTYQFWTTFDGKVHESPKYSFTTGKGDERHFGIDVSYAQGNIDWDTVSQYIDYAIIRCGYGEDNTAYDDTQWYNNVSACERLGIPYGVYLYSYAENDSEALSEAEHVLRLLSGHKPQLPIYYDLENTATVGAQSNAQIVSQTQVFCNRLNQAGYETGIYANDNWWKNRLSGLSVSNNSKWLAAWNGGYANQTGNYGLWQFTSDGHVPGINARVDLDYCQNYDAIAVQTHVPVIDDPEPDFILPAALTTIEAEAFVDNAFTYVKLGEKVDSIGSRAFGDCKNLRHIYIPEKTYPIATDAFEGVPDGLTIHGVAESYAEFYAKKYGYQFIVETE